MEENSFSDEPVEPLAEGGFGARPEQIAPLLESSKAQFGEQSSEYGTTLMRCGDAHMTQGAQSHPQALECYGKALEIFRELNPESPQTAWALDRISAARHASGDAAGAAAALTEALMIWEKLAADGKVAMDDLYRGRRREDLDRLKLFVERTMPAPESAHHTDGADAAPKDETLEELLARKTEYESMAQAFAVAGMEMPAGSQEEYLRLRERIWRRSLNPEPTGKPMDSPPPAPAPQGGEPPRRRRRGRVAMHFLISFIISLVLGYSVDALLKLGEAQEVKADETPETEKRAAFVGPLMTIQIRAYRAVRDSTPWQAFGTYFRQVFAPGPPGFQAPTAGERYLRQANEEAERIAKSMKSLAATFSDSPGGMEITAEEAAEIEAIGSPVVPLTMEEVNAAIDAQMGLKGKDTSLSSNAPLIWRPLTAAADVFIRTYYANGWAGLAVAVIQLALGAAAMYLLNFRLKEGRRIHHPILFIPASVILGTVAAIPIWLVTLAAIQTVGAVLWLAGLAAQFTASLFSLLWLGMKAAEHLGEEVLVKRLSKMLGL